MKIHTIKTETEYKAALQIIDKLLDSDENSKQVEQLEILSFIAIRTP